jgi:hypothetical protein
VYLARLFQKVGVKDRFEPALFGLKLKNLTTGPLRSAKKGGRAANGAMPGLRSLVLEKRTERPDGQGGLCSPTRSVAPRRY